MKQEDEKTLSMARKTLLRLETHAPVCCLAQGIEEP